MLTDFPCSSPSVLKKLDPRFRCTSKKSPCRTTWDCLGHLRQSPCKIRLDAIYCMSIFKSRAGFHNFPSCCVQGNWDHYECKSSHERSRIYSWALRNMLLSKTNLEILPDESWKVATRCLWRARFYGCCTESKSHRLPQAACKKCTMWSCGRLDWPTSGCKGKKNEYGFGCCLFKLVSVQSSNRWMKYLYHGYSLLV